MTAATGRGRRQRGYTLPVATRGLLRLLSLLLLSGCQKHAEKPEEELLRVTSPLRRDTTLSREYVCQIRAIRQIEIRALEPGYLQAVYVDEGQFVRAGQVLFQILPSIYQAEYQKAAAEVQYAEVEYRNAKALADSGVISPNQLALVKAKLEKAKAELALTQAHLQFTTIRAPFDGLVGLLQVRVGSLLEEGELLTTLSDISQLWVYFNVPEAEYLEYASKLKKDSILRVRLRMANGKLFPHEGSVTAVEAEFDNKTGNIPFRATFPNPEGLLRHGETGNIIISQPFFQALLIPQKATFEIMDKKYVYVVEEKDTLRARPIEVAAELPHLYIVARGLTEKDKILLEGLNKVHEGERVSYVFVPPEEALSELHLHAE
ncbi:MAG: efflux RND transporter periplasmic adaptor subunit [Bacteroidia bacterium]|nr:efflux RND transporter periplasmic adaptor subunit [Bacteroidia bacterium]